MHDIERMKHALKTSCSLGNREACEDLESLTQSDQKDLMLNSNKAQQLKSTAIKNPLMPTL
jgi:hypothetical protein